MYEELTPFENWYVRLDPYVLMDLVFYKLASDLLVAAVVALPCLVALFRPMRFLWLRTRLRAAVVLAVSVLWIASWFWLSPVSAAFRDVSRFFDALAPIEGPAPPEPPHSPVL